MADNGHFAVTLKRSWSGRTDSHRRTLAALGLRKIGQTVFLKDTPATRGAIYKVVQLVALERRAGAPPPGARARARATKAKATKKTTATARA